MQAHAQARAGCAIPRVRCASFRQGHCLQHRSTPITLARPADLTYAKADHPSRLVAALSEKGALAKFWSIKGHFATRALSQRARLQRVRAALLPVLTWGNAGGWMYREGLQELFSAWPEFAGPRAQVLGRMADSQVARGQSSADIVLEFHSCRCRCRCRCDECGGGSLPVG